MECSIIMKSGARKGDECAAKAYYKIDGEPVCGKHYHKLYDGDITQEIVVAESLRTKKALGRILQGQIDKKKFARRVSPRYHTGQWQLSDFSHNFIKSGFSCKHDCAYCYIKPMNKRFGRDPEVVDMEDVMETTDNKTDWPTNGNGRMCFFPSSHDIFEENMEDYVDECLKIIGDGHEIMYVSKPHLEATDLFIELWPEDLRDKIHPYITITSDDIKQLKIFEPNCADFEERVRCLRHLYKAGFTTNVMIEPYLSDPMSFIPKIKKYVNGVIMIGPLNYGGAILSGFPKKKQKKLRAYLDDLYSDERVMKLYEKTKDDDTILYKKKFIQRMLKLVH